MWFWSLCLDIPSKDILVGTAPRDCVEIPCVEGKSRFVPVLFLSAPSLVCVLEGSCSSLSFPAPHGEGSLFGKLVAGARGSPWER